MLLHHAELADEGIQDPGQLHAVVIGSQHVCAPHENNLHQVQQQAHASALHTDGQAAVMYVPAVQPGGVLAKRQARHDTLYAAGCDNVLKRKGPTLI